MKEYNIRTARLNDYASLNNLKNQVHDFHTENRPDFFISTENSFPEQYFNALLSSSQYMIFVVEKSNQLIAYAITKIISYESNPVIVEHKRLFIEDICVDENFRSQGTGTIFFEFLENYCKEKGISYIALDVWSFNQEAINFYKKTGMESVIQRFEKSILQ